jgi:hypothetical protein
MARGAFAAVGSGFWGFIGLMLLIVAAAAVMAIATGGRF